jgi:Lon protease-like protein
MSLLHPKYGALPRDFPVFPLTGALLLPYGKLPLNIFEPRYLAMIEDALAGQRMFGLIQPDGHQPAVENGPAMFGVGCLGRLSSFSETDDDRFLISVTGLIRFDVEGELPTRRGYRRVTADFSRYEGDLEQPMASLPQRESLIDALRAYFTVNGFDANWDAIEAMSDNDLVVTLAMICPFDPVEKQALLEAVDPSARAATLLMLLQMGAHSDQGLGLGERPPS